MSYMRLVISKCTGYCTENMHHPSRFLKIKKTGFIIVHEFTSVFLILSFLFISILLLYSSYFVESPVTLFFSSTLSAEIRVGLERMKLRLEGESWENPAIIRLSFSLLSHSSGPSILFSGFIPSFYLSCATCVCVCVCVPVPPRLLFIWKTRVRCSGMKWSNYIGHKSVLDFLCV